MTSRLPVASPKLLKFPPKNPARRPKIERELLEQQEIKRRKFAVAGLDLQLARSTKKKEICERGVTKIKCRYFNTSRGCIKGQRCLDRHGNPERRPAPALEELNIVTVKQPQSATVFAKEKRVAKDDPNLWQIIQPERARVLRQEEDCEKQQRHQPGRSEYRRRYRSIAAKGVGQQEDIYWT